MSDFEHTSLMFKLDSLDEKESDEEEVDDEVEHVDDLEDNEPDLFNNCSDFLLLIEQAVERSSLSSSVLSDTLEFCFETRFSSCLLIR